MTATRHNRSSIKVHRGISLYTHAHTCTRTCTHAHGHRQAHTHTHAHTCARTHALRTTGLAQSRKRREPSGAECTSACAPERLGVRGRARAPARGVARGRPRRAQARGTERTGGRSAFVRVAPNAGRRIMDNGPSPVPRHHGQQVKPSPEALWTTGGQRADPSPEH